MGHKHELTFTPKHVISEQLSAKHNHQSDTKKLQEQCPNPPPVKISALLPVPRLESSSEQGFRKLQRRDLCHFTAVYICCAEKSGSYLLAAFNLLQVKILKNLFFLFCFISLLLVTQENQYWTRPCHLPPAILHLILIHLQDYHITTSLKLDQCFFTSLNNLINSNKDILLSKASCCSCCWSPLGLVLQNRVRQMRARGTQSDTDRSAGTERAAGTQDTAKSTQLIAGTFRK